jgi:chromosome segregation ATPase
LVAAKRKLHLLKSELDIKDEEVSKLKANSATKETEVSSLKSNVEELTKKNESASTEIGTLKSNVEELTKKNESASTEIADLEKTIRGAEAQILKSSNENKANAERLKDIENNLRDVEKKFADSNELLQFNLQTLKERDLTIKDNEIVIVQLKKLVSDLKGSKDQLQMQLDELKTDPQLNSKIEKIQAITRGFNARQRVKRTKMHKDAQTSGVLVATKHTTQGESGWYCAPDGSLYYFVLDGDDWILTCGPVTREAFEEAVSNLKPKKNSSAGYLKISNFDLVTQTVDQPGDLYMSTSTWRLYFAVAVDHLVTENR